LLGDAPPVGNPPRAAPGPGGEVDRRDRDARARGDVRHVPPAAPDEAREGARRRRGRGLVGRGRAAGGGGPPTTNPPGSPPTSSRPNRPHGQWILRSAEQTSRCGPPSARSLPPSPRSLSLPLPPNSWSLPLLPKILFARVLHPS